MKKRDVQWLKSNISRKVSVYPQHAESLTKGKEDDDFSRLAAIFSLSGDGLKVLDDERFSWASMPIGGQNPLAFPYGTVIAHHTSYTSRFEHISSVYEDVDGRCVIFLKPK